MRFPLVLTLSLAVACHSHAPPSRQADVPPVADSIEHPPRPPARRTTTAPLGAAERDSLLRELEAHRTAWRARAITDYRLRVAVGCFCPWSSTPAVLEVRRGKAVALWDLAGKPFGAVREPWSRYTVDAMFDMIENAARKYDVIEVTYDQGLDYPTSIRGDAKVGQVDDWFWATASHLMPSRP